MRVAHVSDLHLLSTEGATFGDFVNKRWTGGINLLLSRGRHYRSEVFARLVDDVNAQNVDHVVCTGDVTNLALPAEFRFARGFFDKLVHGPTNVTCVPGNHDTYVAAAEGAFEREFSEYVQSDASWSGGERPKWPIVRERGEVVVVGLTTSQASPLFCAYGEVGGEQLTWLERVLSDARAAGKFRLVLVHHPPAGPYAKKVRRHLRDHEQLAQVLARTGAELVLHGHEHLDLRAELGGPGGGVIPVRGVQSGSYDPGAGKVGSLSARAERRRARYRVYVIEGARLVGEESRVWNGEGFEAEAV